MSRQCRSFIIIIKIIIIIIIIIVEACLCAYLLTNICMLTGLVIAIYIFTDIATVMCTRVNLLMVRNTVMAF